MKLSKVMALAGVTLLASGVWQLVQVRAQKVEIRFLTFMKLDPDNLNYLTTGKAATANVTSNVVDGLMENDNYGNFVPSMAEDWSVSKDGLDLHLYNP